MSATGRPEREYRSAQHEGDPKTPPADRGKGRRTLLLLALVALAPVVASYAAYYWFTPDKRLNYGELLGPVPAPAVTGTDAAGAAFDLAAQRGKWLLLVATRQACDQACESAVHAARQVRTIQGRERDRVARVLLLPAEVPAWLPPAGEAEALTVARVAPDGLTALPLAPSGAVTLLVVDPLGNIVLRYPANPDLKRVARDLERLLKASHIG